MRAPFEPNPDGSIAARLSEPEVDVVRRVASDLLEALQDTGAPALQRLFPPGYRDDARREEEFHRLTRSDLEDAKRAAARAVVASIDAGKMRRGRWAAELDAETAAAWLGVMNDARLVLGVRLDISEDTDYSPMPSSDPRAPAMNMYFYLSALEEALIDALAAGIPGGASS